MNKLRTSFYDRKMFEVFFFCIDTFVRSSIIPFQFKIYASFATLSGDFGHTSNVTTWFNCTHTHTRNAHAVQTHTHYFDSSSFQFRVESVEFQQHHLSNRSDKDNAWIHDPLTIIFFCRKSTKRKKSWTEQSIVWNFQQEPKKEIKADKNVHLR